MATNQGFTLEIKNNEDNYINLYPKTTQEQVIAWNIGSIYGPYTLLLNKSNWVNKKQLIEFQGITPNDVITCVKMLNGTEQEMKIQDQNYSLLTSIESESNQVIFECKETPTVDIPVQIWWTK